MNAPQPAIDSAVESPRKEGRSGWSATRTYAFDPRQKSPLLAALLSVAPGIGQVYVGYYVRGFVHLFVVAGTITILANELFRGAEPLFGLFLAFFWIYNIVDAGRRAALYNLAVEGGQSIELPQDVKVPAFGGSIGGGLLLIALSSIALSRTAFGFSLAWVEQWWPLGPLAVGAYLIVRALRERASDQPS